MLAVFLDALCALTLCYGMQVVISLSLAVAVCIINGR